MQPRRNLNLLRRAGYPLSGMGTTPKAHCIGRHQHAPNSQPALASSRSSMCGIFCAVSCHKPVWPSPELQERLEKRGPDGSSRKAFTVPHPGEQPQPETHITFFSTVLSLRGETTVQQPYQTDTSQSTLCWNGEAWSVKGVPPGGNDTSAVFHLLDDEEGASHVPTDVALRLDQRTRRAAIIARRLSQIAGPYAFVFHDAVHGLLFYGRDFLGRRSLLTKLDHEGDLLITSTPDDSGGWSEVEADGINCLDLFSGPSDAVDRVEAAPGGRHAVTQVPYHHAGDVSDATSRSHPNA